MIRLKSVLLLFIATFNVNIAIGQGDNRKVTKDPFDSTNWRPFVKGKAPALSPEESLAKFKVLKGFKVELVAAEPMVQAPVFVEFDSEGRLWVCEMQGYMRDTVGGEENGKQSRIMVLEDLDGDGKMDKATPFLESVDNPRSLIIVDGGVLVAETNHILFCQDTNGDLVADKVEKVLDFAEAAVDNIEHAENGLNFNLDNWIYNAKSSRRFKWKDGKIIEDQTRARGQWGFSSDAYGRLFYNHNSGWMLSDWQAYDYQPAVANSGEVYTQKSKKFHPTSPTVAYNRNYKPGNMDGKGRQKVISSVSGISVNNHGTFDKAWEGAFFASESAGYTVAAFKPNKPFPDVTGYIQETYPDKEWDKLSFLTSTDEFFRPVNTKFGPDGCLYVVDMHRGNVQHKKFLTPYLKKQVEERGLDKFINRGRIWRIVPEDYDREKVNEKPKTLIDGLRSSNLWWRLDSQKKIIQGKKSELVEELNNLANDGSVSEFSRIQALWILAELESLSGDCIKKAFSDKNWFIRMTAIRLAGASVGDESKFPDQFSELLEDLTDDEISLVKKYAEFIKSKGYPSRVIKKREPQLPIALSKDPVAKDLWIKGQKQYKMICSGCHQEDGNGLANLAPPLKGSDWVTGSEGKLIASVVHGVTGPIHINGKLAEGYPPIMPPHGHLKDEQLAQILTYVRNCWRNKASVITPSVIKQYRAKNNNRIAPWNEEELNEEY